MSSLIVEVCKIDAIKVHPNADKMEIALIKGWQTCIAKNSFVKGQLCVYIPPDSVLPISLADRLNVSKYCIPQKNLNGLVEGYRIRVARLRGEPSYGLLMALENPEWPVGKDVAALYGITKWEPPLRATDGDAEKPHPAFHEYFTLENIMNFPDVIKEGEEVVFTEKIHGCQAKAALIRDTDNQGNQIFRFMCGSHTVRRKELQTQRKRHPVFQDGKPLTTIDETGKEKEAEWFYETTSRSRFWEVLDKPGIKDLLIDLCNGQRNVIIFGEIFGDVQDMKYGHEAGKWSFRVFDISIDGKYMDYDDKVQACAKHLVTMVPQIYRGPFSKEKVQAFVGGLTTICDADEAGPFKEREGIVITTVKERTENHPGKFFSRTALKAINFKYLERKNATEYH